MSTSAEEGWRDEGGGAKVVGVWWREDGRTGAERLGGVESEESDKRRATEQVVAVVAVVVGGCPGVPSFGTGAVALLVSSRNQGRPWRETDGV